MTTYTLQSAQNNLSKILDDMDAGLSTSVDLVKRGGGSVIGKIVKFSTYDDAAIDESADLIYVPQILLSSGQGYGSNGLYKMTKLVSSAAKVDDGTVKAKLAYLGQGSSGVLFQAVLGGPQGDDISVEVVDPAGNNQALEVSVEDKLITISLATDGSGNLTSTFTQIAEAVNAAQSLVTATVIGTGSLVPESVKASLQVTQGAGGIAYTAADAGTAGNSISVRYVNPTVLGKAHYSYPDGVSGGNGIDFQAVAAGTGGNAISIAFVVAGNDTPLSVAVVGNAITVNVATDNAGAATSTLTQVKAALDGSAAASALVASTITGTASTVATAMAVQNLTSDFALSVSVVGTGIIVNLATNTAGVITSTATNVQAAIDASETASVLVDTVVTGVGSTVAAALAATLLAGGSNDGTLAEASLDGGDVQPGGIQKFQAVCIYRKRSHSTNAGTAPTLTPRAVMISAAHATFLGL